MSITRETKMNGTLLAAITEIHGFIRNDIINHENEALMTLTLESEIAQAYSSTG